MTELGAYSPGTAREILDAFRRLKASGLLDKARPAEPLRPIPAPIWVENVSGEEIPAYACMQVTGTVDGGDRTYLEVDKPGDAIGLGGGYVFNGPNAIATGKRGVAHAGPHVRAQGDGSTCTAGQGWAPQKNSWEVTQQDGGDFQAIGDDSLGTNVVRIFTHAGSRGLYQFTLTSGWSVGSDADADISFMDSTSTGTNAKVNDPKGIFSTLTSGDGGYCQLMGGRLWAIQSPCP